MNALAIFLGQIGPGSWVIIGIAILLLFGGKKIPELMKGLGGGVKEFKNAMKDEEEPKSSKKEDDTKE
ncbi:twin-arginine translocase TatA/TatE family subunit [Flavobacterium sp. NRK F10]|uniref:Sec-independent protein translocase protein TatA n=1 Tax=Flavobacterium sediminis TaxID=2201181 RepID=A0A2U8QTY5_9FLAO|nr:MULTISPECIES: twin-arginine translocase TatA/TatE family subunit [Flavobacterium]AWM13650.1 twin-arginine translocase TatA/TatE family subunit [Flavobacterium sediminis]MCO6174773.1 twin-arginine translocase TatA/TatE family subunit [Flavobacterium sp. NRK F10]